MKSYQKPQATIVTVANSNQLASGLTNWLEQNSVGLKNSNITTYLMNS